MSLASALAPQVLDDSSFAPEQTAQVEKQKEKDAVGAAIKTRVREVSDKSRVFYDQTNNT